MAVPSQIFNASTTSLNVSVNNGAVVSLNASAPPNWQPQGGSITFSLAGPGANMLGYGTNTISVSSPSGGPPSILTLKLSSNQQWFSLQLYLFSGNGSRAWVLLNNGQLVDQGKF